MALRGGKLHQPTITPTAISNIIHAAPRRMKLATEWTDALKPPSKPGDDWMLLLPFVETLWNAFESMCGVQHIGQKTTKTGRPFTFLKGSSHIPTIAPRVEAWLSRIGKYVAIRDCLAMSFALDYDRQDGDPRLGHTALGDLRTKAKTYGGATTAQAIRAADDLAAAMVEFVTQVDAYGEADAIVAVPPSDPTSPWDLPGYLARKIAPTLGLEDLCNAVRTPRKRPQVKNAALDEKLKILRGTVSIDAPSVRGKTIVLIEDLYQSGVTINHVAMELLNAGASEIFGLSCVKTCRNTDNVTE